MTHEDLVFEALSYHRHVGAYPKDLRPYIELREPTPHSPADDFAALRSLEAAGKAIQVGKRWYLTTTSYRQARGRALSPDWRIEDTWILLAVLLCTRGGTPTLDRIIGAADFINHAIPTIEEIHGALNRLHAGRLITWRNGVVTPKGLAISLLTKAEQNSKRDVYSLWQALSRLLNCPCCGVSLKAVRWRITVDEEMLQESYAKYLRSIRGR